MNRTTRAVCGVIVLGITLGHHVTASETAVKQILNEFTDALAAELERNPPPILFPGVADLLAALQGRPGCFLGLVTGNVSRGAELKLRAAGIDHFFPVGGFGDDAMERPKLPPIAIRRAERHYGEFFSRENIWIVGDSVFDIRCARENGLPCLAVCTGHSPAQVLREERPEALVEDFSDTAHVLSLLGIAEAEEI